MSDKLTRIALVSADKCKPKKCVARATDPAALETTPSWT
jgi:translation initiation factor RLI1